MYYLLPNNDVVGGEVVMKRITRNMCHEFIRDLLGEFANTYCWHEYSTHDVSNVLNIRRDNALGWLMACKSYGLAEKNGEMWLIKGLRG